MESVSAAVNPKFVLVRLRQGDSDRDISRSLLMGTTEGGGAPCARRRARGWLVPKALTADDDTMVGQARRARSMISSAEPYRRQVER